MSAAFQPGAFQGSAFQSLGVAGPAFQSGAFQFGAFQTSGSRGVGGGGKARGRKYIVRKDGKLLVFKNEADALTVLSATKDPQEIAVPEVAKPPKRKKVREVETHAEEVVSLAHVEELAQRQGELEAVRAMLAAAQYCALMALVQQMQDEEDVEMLLMAA